MRKFFVILASALSLATVGRALVIQDLPASALSASQGSASASLLEGRGDAFQNPSAMAFHSLTQNLVSATFIPMSLGRYAQSLSYMRSLSRSTAAGVQARLISTGGIEARDAAGTKTGDLRYTEWEAGGGLAWRSRYHVAAGLQVRGVGQSFTGASSGGLQASGGLLLRPFLSYPLHVGVSARAGLVSGSWGDPPLNPGGTWGLAYEILPSFWAGTGGGYGSSPLPLGGAVSWTHDQAGASLRAAASAESVTMGGGYTRKGRFRLDYAFVLGLEGPSSRHLATTEFEF